MSLSTSTTGFWAVVDQRVHLIYAETEAPVLYFWALRMMILTGNYRVSKQIKLTPGIDTLYPHNFEHNSIAEESSISNAGLIVSLCQNDGVIL